MRKLSTLILGVVLLCSSFSVFGTHIAGGDISYECISPGQFRLALNLYRDCSPTSAGLGTTANLCITNTCGFNTSETLNLVSGYPIEVSQTCSDPAFVSECQGGTVPAWQLFRYEKIVTLSNPGSCTGYTISYGSCCRATSLNGAGQPAFYLDTRLEYLASGCNNSPQITGPPNIQFCNGITNNLNYWVTDVDFDSLTFELIDAQAQNGTCGSSPIPYINQITGQDPIPNSNFTLDPISGQFSFTPTQIGPSIVAVKIHEYGPTGIYHGWVMRDIVFNVVNCMNSVPTVNSGASVTGSATLMDSVNITACSGQSFCYSVSFSDPDLTDTLFLNTNINSVLPGATWSVTGTNPLTFEFCWTATPLGVSTTTFGVSVNDGQCPIIGLFSMGINIHFNTGVFGGPDLSICTGDSVQFSAQGTGPFNWLTISGDPIIVGTNFSCNPCPNPWATPSQTTEYVITGSSSNGCPGVDTVTVNVVDAPSFNFGWLDSIGCQNDSGEVFVNINSPGVHSILWSSPDPGLLIGNPTASITEIGITSDTNYVLVLTVTNSVGCATTDSLSFFPSLGLNGSSDSATICFGDTFLFNGPNGPYTFSWTPTGTVSDSTSGNPLLYPDSTTTYTMFLSDTVSGCEDSLNFTLFVSDSTCVTGVVSTSSNMPMDSTWVYLLDYDTINNIVVLYDSIMTDTSGYFELCITNASFYLGVVPNFNLYPNEMQSYHPGVVDIQSATLFTKDCMSQQASLSTVASAMSNSIGSIGGNVFQGSNKDQGVGEPVTDLRIILHDDQLTPLQDAYTDASGYFRFEVGDLADYYIYLDQFGVDNGMAPVVSLTDKESNQDSLIFKLLPNQLILFGPVGFEGKEDPLAGRFKLGPNPNDGSFRLEWLGDAVNRTVKLEMTNALGQQVLSQSVFGLETGQQLEMKMTDPVPGMYLLKISIGERETYTRVLVR